MGAQDADAEDDIASIAHAVSGADYGQNGVTADAVAVTVTDNETASTAISLSVDPEARLDGEIGYGLDTPRGLLTPRFGFSVSGEGRAYRMGGGLNLGAGFDASVEVGLRELAAEGGRVG